MSDALNGLLSGPLAGFFTYLSLAVHLNDFPKGIVDTKDVAYYATVIIAALFVATRILEARRWKA